MELEHFSHKHPLLLMEEPNLRNEFGKLRKCNICLDPLLWMVRAYVCNQCEFFIHESCAQLPREIQNHPSHPYAHSLTLYANCKNPNVKTYCDSCDILQENNFLYKCSICNFDLDVICAKATEIKIKHPSHNHPLTRLIKPLLCVCDACGDKHEEGIFYQCTTCVNFSIHQACASILLTVEPTIHHKHSLILAYAMPSQYASFEYNCDICDKLLHPRYWVFYCGQCRFFAHVNCATSTNEPFMSILLPRGKDYVETKEQDASLDVVRFPVEDEFVNLMSHFRKGTRLVENDGTCNEINHFSHDHPLILFDVQANEDNSSSQGKFCPTNGSKNNERLCAACVKSIWVGPFYKCAIKCNFFLHKCCAELPHMVEHPCHPEHPLILLPKSPHFFNLFICDGCKFRCNGFTYSCVDCGYDLDVECGSLPNAIKHEAHGNHLLFLKISNSCVCNVCGHYNVEGQLSYSCETCSFKVHTYCVTFPPTIRHRYDELHPFTLTYSPVKDHSDDYYCDICEEELNPKCWFYHCVDCDQSLHPTCVPPFDKWSRIKFGGTLNIVSHPHPLTLVPVIDTHRQYNFVQTVTVDTKCDHCGNSFISRQVAFKCFKCNFTYDFSCAKKCGQQGC